MTTIRNESMDSRNESTFLRISYTNPASLLFLQTKLRFSAAFEFFECLHKFAFVRDRKGVNLGLSNKASKAGRESQVC